MIYDIFYVSKNNVDEQDWKQFRSRFPSSQKIENVKSFNDIKNKAFTKLFWVVWNDLTVVDNFNFDYKVSTWDQSYIHVWLNGENYDGVALFSKESAPSAKEFEHRFYVNKKEIDIVASTPKVYPTFIVNNYTEYQQALENSPSTMFWGVWSNVEIVDDQIFKTYFSHHNSYDRNENHVFKNICDDLESFVNGVVLFSKNKAVSKKEIEHKFLINKKEYDIVVSKSKPYDKFIIEKFEDYENALNETTQDLFWIIWPDVEIINDTILNTKLYDRNVNHIFLNSSTEGDSYISGIILCSKNKKFTKKEFDHRYLIDKTEHPIVVTKNKTYAIFKFSNYKDYLHALESSPTEMFWMIPNDVDLNLDFDFLNFTFNFNNQYDRSINHVFLNDKYYDGVILTSKKIKISEREIYHRFLIDKKEYPVQASTPKPFDIIFISYNEKNADENYENLKSRFPRVKRVHGVKGIQNAHIEAANLAETDMFWVVDADAIIEDTFTFEIDYIPYYDRISRINLNKTVHVWSSKNPINDLVYGYGGVKLLPRRLTANMDIQNPDMTTSISDSFKIMSEISNVTGFNVDEFSTWRSAFRECAKLSSRVIDRNFDDENDERLYIWCNVGKDRPFGEYAINGARAGKQFGEEHIQDPAGLNSINDYEWLKNQFDQVKDKIK